MIWKAIGRFSIWLSLLVVGLCVTSTLFWSSSIAGSGVGTGVLSYRFKCRFIPKPELQDEQSAEGIVMIEGRASPRFVFWGDFSPAYKKAEIDWYLYSLGGEKSEGKVEVNLIDMIFSQNGSPFSVNKVNLASLFGIEKVTDTDELLIDRLIEFLDSAKSGTLPKPNHHGHTFDEPVHGNMQHGASGFALLPLDLLWVISWSIFGVVRLSREKSNKQVESAVAITNLDSAKSH